MSDVVINVDRIHNLLGRRDLGLRYAASEVGSTVYLGETGEDDLDLAGVFIETPQQAIMHSPQSQSIRTQLEGERSRVGDIDIIMHPLRKFAHLLAKGNPSILTQAFSPNVVIGGSWWPKYVQRLHGRAVSQQAGAAFQGYLVQQMERWQGKRGQKNVSRPELVEAYGFDTKYAYHAIRLGIQGVEYLATGKLTLPMPRATVQELRAVRTGGYTEKQALAWADSVLAELQDVRLRSPLPARPNLVGLESIVAEAYLTEWRDRDGE